MNITPQLSTVNNNRIFGLDILRAFAIFFVMLEHGQHFFAPEIIRIHKYFIIDGVTLFFVLSGFLIGNIIIKTFNKTEHSFKDLIKFWRNRWLRTLPSYWLVLSALILLASRSVNNATIDYWKYYLFIQNINVPHPKNFFPEAWSLAVEEWFYLSIPFVLYLSTLAKKMAFPKRLLVLAISILLGTTVFRHYRFLAIEDWELDTWDLYFRKQVITRLDSIMYGVLAAYIFQFKQKSWQNNVQLKFYCGIAMLILVQILAQFELFSLESYYNCVLSFSLSSIGTALLIPYLQQIKNGNGWIAKGITQLSAVSYALYLVNLSCFNILIKYWPKIELRWPSLSIETGTGQILAYLIFWTISLIMAKILYQFFEVPIMKWRRHLK